MRVLQVISVLFAITVVAMVATTSPDIPPSRSSPQPVRDKRVDELNDRIGSMEQELRQVHALLRREIESRNAAALRAPVPAGDDATAPGVDERDAGARSTVSINRLKTHARALALDSGKIVDALDAWAAVAEHATDPRDKAEAWTEHGQIHRKLRQYREAESSWQNAVDVAGMHTSEGQAASFLVGQAQGRYDVGRAYRTFERLSGTSGVAKSLAASARLSMAIYAKAAGETSVARREYERVVSEFQNDREQHYRDLARIASERLDELN